MNRVDSNNSEETKQQESRLRILHQMLYEADIFPGLITPYTKYVRSLREKLHPLGVWEAKITEVFSQLKFKVDLGDRLGCDFYYGYYQEYFDCQLFFSLVSLGDLVVDVGANFGFYAVSAAKKVGDLGVVYAFEPNEDAYGLLEENVNLNDFSTRVKCYPACVGAEDGEVKFYVSEESSFSSMTATGRSKIRSEVTVPMFTLDSCLSQEGNNSVKAIKIDVEGYEYAVLRGGMETWKRSPDMVMMMEVSSKNLDTQRREELIAILTQLYELNFQGWVVDVAEKSLKLLATPEEMAGLNSANVFVTMAGSPTQARLHSACEDLCEKAVKGISPRVTLPQHLSWGQDEMPDKSLLSVVLGELSASYHQQQVELEKATTQIKGLSQKSEDRLQEIYKRDAKIQELREENQRLQKRDLLTIGKKIWSRFKGG